MPEPLDLAGETPWPARQLAESRWRRAAEGTDLEQAQLANRLSVTELLAALDVGGRLGRTALAALAASPESYGERGALCERLGRATPRSRESLLDALLEVMSRGPYSVEDRSSAKDERCRQALGALLSQPDLSPHGSDLVGATLALLPPPHAAAATIPGGPPRTGQSGSREP